MNDSMIAILDMVATERGRQEFLKTQGKFAYTCADAEMTHSECMTVLAEEAGEVAHEVNEGIGPDRYVDKRRLLKELIETAAVSVAWAEKVHAEIEGVNPEIKHDPIIDAAKSEPPKYQKGDIVYIKSRGINFTINHINLNHGGINMHRYYGKSNRGEAVGAYENELVLTSAAGL